MIILTGNSLGERQKNLNEKVNKAAADNSFDEYNTESGKNDVDIIFMIDLAAKNKNVDFIIEILKSGDVVHITRALNKCAWLCDDKFADIINIDDLHINIFPSMSIKMKKKLLSMLSINLKLESRSIDFYEYCMKEGLFKIAMKFLCNTPETFKQEEILQNSKGFKIVLSNKEEALPNFIGNSFTLAQTCLNSTEVLYIRSYCLDLLRYMYSISSEQYLELLEKYKNNDYRNLELTRFGSRLSKDIIKKHKNRILKNPLLYVNLLKKDKIAKNSTLSDVKNYAALLLPDDASTFWNINFYEKYKFILDIIPLDEKFCFLKNIFTEKYPHEKFEMCEQFYYLNFYKIMTTKEKEDWALHHITSGKEILGFGNDYIWYKFVCFDKAFEEIKKIIAITPDSEKRIEIVCVLVDSAKTQNELEKLLNYFYNRHVNEMRHHKMQFLGKLVEKHKVFDFDDKCWTALEKIFYSLDLYLNLSNYTESDYRVIALVYYIIKDKTVPKELNDLIDKDIITVFEVKKYSRELEPKQEEMVFQYMHNFFLMAVEVLASKGDFKSIVRYIPGYLDLLLNYSKTKDDISENMNKAVKLYWSQFKNHRLFGESKNENFSERNIKLYMKKDATLVIDEFPLIKKYIQDRFGRTNWLIQKLKIYFHNDIAKKYLQLLNDCLSDNDVHYLVAQVAVYGIFKLADELFKIDFMQKYVPTNPKIDHVNIPRNLLQIQQAICGYACMSRPPLPIEYINQYLTGDYVKNCLPIFNYYLMNLPIPACISFVKSTIDKPISIQKHGLRLAFQCFSTEHLKTLINDVWKRTKNISLRKVLYKSLVDKVLKESEHTQMELFELLKILTLDLHQDDDNELFALLSDNKMPNHLKGQLLVSGWEAVKKLPERSVNFERMTKVIKAIENDFNLVPEDEVTNIIGDHVSKMLDEKEILNIDNYTNNYLKELLKAKWELTFRYIANVYNDKQLKHKVDVTRHIIKRCLEMWNNMRKEKYVIREFCRTFVKDLEEKSYDCHEIESFPNVKIIFNTISEDLQKVLPEHELFVLILQLRLSDITRDVIISCKQNIGKGEILVAVRTSLVKFAESFVMLLKEYIDNGKYFATFHGQIESDVKYQLLRLNRALDVCFTLNLNEDDLCVLLCVDLLKFEIKEVYLVILKLLPVNYKGIFVSDYENTISTVKRFKNTEVQYYMFEKFVNSDFMFRSQMFT